MSCKTLWRKRGSVADKIVVALGGNALIGPQQRGTIEEQSATLRESLVDIFELILQGHRVLLTHGNGPQVGNILIRVEEARSKAYELPLDVCVAQSQGEMGYLIQQSLQNLLIQHGIHKPIVTLITRVVVDENDSRMQSPTKPIGPFYTQEQATRLRAKGVHMIEDSHRGYRRVVRSPMPLRIIEQEIIKQLFDSGVIVVAAGGGGIPVCFAEDGTLEGVEAVVDKDLASSLLATAIQADKLLDLTAVEKVKLYFGSDKERAIDSMTVEQAKQYLTEDHFAPGSMGPKIEAAIGFLERGGKEVIITLPEKALEALRGKTGTHIYPQ